MTKKNDDALARMDTMGDSTDSRTATTVAPTAHTPLPWIAKIQRSRAGDHLGWIVDASNGDRIGWSSYANARTNDGDSPPYEQSGANALFLTRAVNSYDDLLAALYEVAHHADDECGFMVTVRAAIAKATQP